MANEVAVMTVTELGVVAEAMFKGGLFGFKNKDQAFSLMILAQAQGQHPATIVQDYHIFSTGKASLRSDTVLARFQAQGGKIAWLVTTDKMAKAKFSHPQAGDCEFAWTIEEAQRANLLGKDVWKAYPADMLRARCIYRGVRAMLPMVFGGMYGKEEMEDSGLDREAQHAEHQVLETTVNRALPSGLKVIGKMVSRQDLVDTLAACTTKEDFASVRGWIRSDFSDENSTIPGCGPETYINVFAETWKKSGLGKPAAVAPEQPATDHVPDFLARVKACNDPTVFAALEKEFNDSDALSSDEACINELDLKRMDFDSSDTQR